MSACDAECMLGDSFQRGFRSVQLRPFVLCTLCVYSHARRQFSERIQVCTVAPLCVMYLMFTRMLGDSFQRGFRSVQLRPFVLCTLCVYSHARRQFSERIQVCTVAPLCVMYLMFTRMLSDSFQRGFRSVQLRPLVLCTLCLLVC